LLEVLFVLLSPAAVKALLSLEVKGIFTVKQKTPSQANVMQKEKAPSTISNMLHA